MILLQMIYLECSIQGKIWWVYHRELGNRAPNTGDNGATSHSRLPLSFHKFGLRHFQMITMKVNKENGDEEMLRESD